MTQNDEMACCETFLKAMENGTDSEGCFRLIERGEDGWEMGDGLPALRFCPWCGSPLA